MLGNKTSLNKVWKIDITQNISSSHNEMKLEIPTPEGKLENSQISKN